MNEFESVGSEGKMAYLFGMGVAGVGVRVLEEVWCIR